MAVESEMVETVSPVAAPMPDYEAPGVDNKRVAGGLAGVAGVFVTFVLCVIIGKLAARRRGRVEE